MTNRDLLKSHPNRIVLDAMSGCYKYIKAEESVWRTKNLLEEGADVLVVIGGGISAVYESRNWPVSL
ncbi:hypothetical protein IT084_10545 [Desulfallas sp. Bu1-1]|uniref:hypothetical protein n=1 Tax=Desulfallas sp. Bu1-1 TaxID=2787620 RepID=UPI00189D7761|nr:hypothetical protein [Desulfallas sp. Bu1-1]MBF7083411.1 hypothetical protein [Desulfallas sp. Bu1-1]